MFRRRANYIPFILLLGALVAYPFWFFEAHQARGWPTTTGEVVESRIHQRESHYYPVVAYRYSVDGRSFTSRTIWLSSDRRRFSSFQEAQAVIVSYPLGSQIDVRYSPANPERAALIIDEISMEIPLAILVALVIAGAYFFFVRRRETTPPV